MEGRVLGRFRFRDARSGYGGRGYEWIGFLKVQVVIVVKVVLVEVDTVVEGPQIRLSHGSHLNLALDPCGRRRGSH